MPAAGRRLRCRSAGVLCQLAPRELLAEQLLRLRFAVECRDRLSGDADVSVARWCQPVYISNYITLYNII